MISVLLSGCGVLSDEVPPGYVGIIKTPEGYVKQILQPGYHTCYGRDKIILIETKEDNYSEKLSILCKDDLNFKFDLKIICTLKITDFKNLVTILNKQGSLIDKKSVLKFDYLYKIYVQPQARSIARTTVSQYNTTDIRENRKVIEYSIAKELVEAMKNSPIEIKMVKSSNYDYPNVITKAVEKAREREIAIKQEQAKQAVELLKANNRLKIAEKMKMVRAAEAEAESVYMKILGQNINEKYLQLRNVEAKMKLFENVQAGDKVIVQGNAPIIPMLSVNKK